MFLDRGIDTGRIIHQIRPRPFITDNLHTLGNRIILQMVDVYKEIVANFNRLTREPQTRFKGKLIKRSDFTEEVCVEIYKKFPHLVNQYSRGRNKLKSQILTNRGLMNASSNVSLRHGI